MNRLNTIKLELADAKYDGLTDSEAASLMNQKTFTLYDKVDYTDVASYLIYVDKYIGIIEGTSQAAKNFSIAMSTFKSFDLNKQAVAQPVNAVLDALVSEGLLDDTDKVAILGMAASRLISRAEQLGLGVVYDGEITKARAM